MGRCHWPAQSQDVVRYISGCVECPQHQIPSPRAASGKLCSPNTRLLWWWQRCTTFPLTGKLSRLIRQSRPLYAACKWALSYGEIWDAIIPEVEYALDISENASMSVTQFRSPLRRESTRIADGNSPQIWQTIRSSSRLEVIRADTVLDEKRGHRSGLSCCKGKKKAWSSVRLQPFQPQVIKAAQLSW